MRRRARRSCACTATVTATYGAATSTAASASGARPAAHSVAPSIGPARATSGNAARRHPVAAHAPHSCLRLKNACSTRELLSCRALASDGSGHTYVGGSSGNVKALRLRFTGARNNCCVEHAGTLHLRVSCPAVPLSHQCLAKHGQQGPPRCPTHRHRDILDLSPVRHLCKTWFQLQPYTTAQFRRPHGCAVVDCPMHALTR